MIILGIPCGRHVDIAVDKAGCINKNHSIIQHLKADNLIMQNVIDAIANSSFLRERVQPNVHAAI